MVTPTTYLGRRFADFGATFGSDWPSSDHADTMACRDLEERLAYGRHLYQLVQEGYQADKARLQATGQAYDLPAAKYTESLLTLWIAPATAALRQLDAMEAKGFAVDRAAEFREAVLDVQISLSIPVERAAEQAERFAREGLQGGRTTEELRRELRNRMEASG